MVYLKHNSHFQHNIKDFLFQIFIIKSADIDSINLKASLLY